MPRGSSNRRQRSRDDSADIRRSISTFRGDDEFNGRSSFSFSWVSSLSSTKLVLGGTLIIVAATFSDPSSLLGAAKSPVGQFQNDVKIGDALPHFTKDGKYHGRYPNSLLTLFYPFTLLRDVVLDQPVNRTDVPLFWHVHISVSELFYFFIFNGKNGIQCQIRFKRMK